MYRVFSDVAVPLPQMADRWQPLISSRKKSVAPGLHPKPRSPSRLKTLVPVDSLIGGWDHFADPVLPGGFTRRVVRP